MLNENETKRQTLIATQSLIDSLEISIKKMADEIFDQISDDNFWDILEELDSYNGCLDCDRWYSMDELDEALYGMTPTDILSECKDIDVYDEYFRCGIYGWESGDREYDSSYRDTEIYCDILDRLTVNELSYYLDDDAIIKIRAIEIMLDELKSFKTSINQELEEVIAEIQSELEKETNEVTE